MSTYISTDFVSFLDDGDVNEFGIVYFGLPNVDAKTNPKQPFLDPALTIPANATQMLTSGGKFAQRLYLSGTYSVQQRDEDDVLFDEDLMVRDSSSLIGSSGNQNGNDIDDMNQFIDLQLVDSIAVLRSNLAAGLYNAGDRVAVRDSIEAPGLVEAAGSNVDDGGMIIVGGSLAWIRTIGIPARPQWWGVTADGVTDDSAAMASALSSSAMSLRFTVGIYRCQLNNDRSYRTFIFDENAVIDGVIHITGTGPATSPPQVSVTWVDGVRMIGTAVSTIRFGTFYCRNLNVDKVRITKVAPQYLNQTATGGTTGVHLFFGTKDCKIGEIVCESGALNYNLSVDQGPVTGPNERPTDITIDKFTIMQTDVTGIVTSETTRLKIGQVVQHNQGGANVAWISSNDVDLKVDDYYLNGNGATSGQTGVYLSNLVNDDSSAYFKKVFIENVPGIGFRTFNRGTVKMDRYEALVCREGMRIQSRFSIDEAVIRNTSEVGIYLFDNFAAGTYIGRCNISGTSGSGVSCSSNDVTISSVKISGYPSGLILGSAISNYNSSFIDISSCTTALGATGAGLLNLGVLYLHSNTLGIAASGLGEVSFDFIQYDGNVTDTNYILESAPGFKGKRTRASMSANNGDASIAVGVQTSESTQIFSTPITAVRTVTFSTAGAMNGDKFRIVRAAAATGAFNISTAGTFANKALAAGEWCQYEFQGSGWHIVGFGTL